MRISVIIPVLNEAGGIAVAIARTRDLGPCEIVVVDGGSSDRTLDAAVQADLCLESAPGRAVQQNSGAAASHGDVLLFLHADCRLEPGAIELINRAFQDPNCVGGCFRQRIDAQGFGYRLIEFGNEWRVRLLTWAYGDQGIFVRRDVFTSLGGFPEIEVMEDLFFMKRLKRRGRFCLLNHRIHVSARRWQNHGIARQTLRNWSLVILAHCGVSPKSLAAYYPATR